MHSAFCQSCGEKYQRMRPVRGTSCSRACAGRLRRLKHTDERICPVCRKSFLAKAKSNKRYCSIACFNRRGRRKADMVRQCNHCGRDYERQAGQTKRKFCSRECALAFNHGQKQFSLGLFQRGLSQKPTVDPKLIFPRCQRCGWDTEPQVLHRHHKDRNRGNNATDNIEVLCPNCHVLEHFRVGDSIWRPFSSLIPKRINKRANAVGRRRQVSFSF